ncbi:MAG: DUF6146 family protein [Bacteroidales bacterium]|nr:DUF6146 family protein [Bacteroidales bacterium]MCF8334578.1 DUF6146 family protein [Bacteroidales bacterium]
MKGLNVIMMGILFLVSGNFAQGNEIQLKNTEASLTSPMPDTVKADSTEYELIIFDGRFESWYIQRKKPKWYHTENYYKHWNQRYVNEWNYRYNLGDPRFDSYIEYQPTKDYGLELEHKLYYYFEYFQEKHNISLK